MIKDLPALLEALWADYSALNPQAKAISGALAERGETVRNDHVALRTFDDLRVDLEVLARPFLESGYAFRGSYAFPDRHLIARHLEADAELPKVFISQLTVSALSDAAVARIGRLLEQVPPDSPDRFDFCVSGRPWEVTRADYEALRGESEYAAWLAAFGFRANHFTVDVGGLTTIEDLEAMNALIRSLGFDLNESGGAIKGSPSVFLEQSSTMAAEVSVAFSDGSAQIPACYYEFARRYDQPDGTRFEGFIAGSADRLFSSTDPR